MIEIRKVVNFREFLYIFTTQEIVEEIMSDIDSSDISFGNNPDTLLDANTAEEFMAPYGLKISDEFDDVWFSLGC
jgi:hypothetical protein